jgi:4'-phosphopantetheinyl transferase EntD
VIERILPPAVAAAEARSDSGTVRLFGAEEGALGWVVPKRRREFTTGRGCARRALAELGLAPVAIVPGPRGDPQWPPGIVGSITHCEGYRACAVARKAELAAVGIDAERHLPLPRGVLREIARPEEFAMVRRLRLMAPEVCWDRLLYCAKEAGYKAWSALGGGWLDFTDARVAIDPGKGTFCAQVARDARAAQCALVSRYAGHWLVSDGLILSATAVPPR